MLNLEINLLDLTRIENGFTVANLQQKLIPVIGQAKRDLVTALDKAVVDTYMVSTADVREVTLDRTTSKVKADKLALEVGLRYRYKPKKLSSFPYTTSRIELSKPNIFPFRRSDGRLSFREKRWAESASVKVKRSEGFKEVVGKHGFGGFLQRRATKSAWGGKGSPQTNIYERQQQATWNNIQDLDRAPIKPLFGPSITQMLSHVWETDNAILAFRLNFANYINQRLDL